MYKKIIVLIGTRPEAIKMAPVLRALERQSRRVQTMLAVSSQHREMLRQVLDTFKMVPHVDLDIMTHDQTLSQVTTRNLSTLDPFLERERPDIVLVQGDTTTALAAGLAAFYAKIPLGHVEAGLRTGRMFEPFPEEMNRRLIDQLSTLLFAPTERARHNLLREGIDDSQIYVTGNTVVDALLSIKRRIDKGRVVLDHQVVDLISDGGSSVILVTAHRRENFGTPLRNICLGVREIARCFPRKRIVFPVHMNPKVRGPVKLLLQGIKNVRLIEPLDYISFVYLMARSELILTDSGGIQEEATCLNTPTLVLRECTERVEAEACGHVKVIGTDLEAISHNVRLILRSPKHCTRQTPAVSPYGDGRASGRIVRVILNYLGVH